MPTEEQLSSQKSFALRTVGVADAPHPCWAALKEVRYQSGE